MRFLKTLWVFASALGAFAAAPRAGLNVGTSIFAVNDVVKDGIVQSTWSPNTPPHILDENTYELNFWISLNSTASPNPQPFDVTTVSTDSTVWTAATFEDSTYVSNGQSVRSNVKFTCSGNSHTETDPLHPGTTGTWNIDFPQGTSDDVNVFFTKICTRPKMNIGTKNAQGQYVPFISNNQFVGDWTYMANEDEDITTFYVWLTVDNPATDATDVKLVEQGFYSNNDIMAATYTITGNAQALPTDPSVSPASISITYNCKPKEYDATSPVEITLFFGWDFTFDLRWTKDCSNDPTENFAPVDIGTGPFGDDVVLNGAPVGDWGSANGALLAAGIHSTSFYMSLNGTATVPSLAYEVHLYGSFPANFYDAEVTNNQQGTLTPGQDTRIDVDLTCIQPTDPKRPEIQTMTITFPGTNYDAVVAHFYLECINPGFDVSFTLGGSDIAKGGVFNQDWAYVSPVTEKQTGFWAVITNPLFQTYTFEVSETSFNPAVIQPIALPRFPVAQPAGASNPKPFSVIYNCVDGVTGVSHMNVVLDYGWAQTLNITYIKQCGSAPAPAGSSSGGGMNPAGIFFLTVFCIGSFVYICGIFYKRFKLGMTGPDCLPGIDFCRRMLAPSQPRFTPQIDYDEGARNNSAGMSYQTDL